MRKGFFTILVISVGTGVGAREIRQTTFVVLVPMENIGLTL